MKRIILLLTLWNVCFGLCMAQKQYQLKSPDGKLNINIEMVIRFITRCSMKGIGF